MHSRYIRTSMRTRISKRFHFFFFQEYNLKIQEQRKDMDESAKSAERVRNDFQMFRNRSVVIGSDEQCAICSVYLLLKPFFVFPCGHKFHGDCLETQLINHLSEYSFR